MLEIRDLVKVYPGPVAALQGVDLEVPAGMFGLLGPNGAGKTTLMRIVAGLLEATSGSVRLHGVDALAEPENVRAQLGYLPQDFGFYPHLSGEKMLLHLLRLKGVRAEGGLRRLARELLARVGLEDAGRRKVRGYSGGMRQRLGVAQAVAGDPRLIIVDEPTAGLDPEERLRFYRLLAELAEERIVLLSTHIVEDVAVLCPRFAVIREGRLVASTTPAEAIDGIRGTIFESVVETEAMSELARTWDVTHTLPFQGRQRVRLHVPAGQPPPGFAAVEPTLEDAYLVLMRSRNGAGPQTAPVPEAAP